MVTFIGVGSAFNTELGNTSAWMKQSDRLLLIDCGGSVFERLLKQRILQGIRTLDICLTHTHGDHVGSLGDLVLYCFYILKIKPTLRHPAGDRIRTLMDIFGVPEELYILENGPAFSLENWLEVSFVQQVHADTMPAFGLLLKGSDRTGWYSGDSREIPEEIHQLFLQGHIHDFYQDTSGMDYPDSLHMSLNRLVELIPESERGRVVCMHQDEAFDRDSVENLGFRIAKAEV